MRLFDTWTRSLVELPPPPGPIRMYAVSYTHLTLPTIYSV